MKPYPRYERPRCCVVEAVAPPAEPDLSDAYTEWKSWRSEDFGHPTAQASAYFDALWRRFVSESPATPRVLDVGFGNGQFLGWCRQRGMPVFGIETAEALLARARAAGFDCAESPDAMHGKPFDLIVLFDVLEHLPESRIAPFLDSLARRLSPDGLIILRTPNGGSPFGLHHQHGDPTHASILTASKLKFLCARVGLTLSYCGKDLRPLRAGPLWKLPARMLRALLYQLSERLVRFVFAPQPRGVLSANLLAVLRLDCRDCQENGDSRDSRDSRHDTSAV